MSSKDQVSTFDVISVMLLVAGACIGGGMLVLPVGTCLAGFIPATAMMFLCWFLMTVTSLLILEVNLWLGQDVHMITMVSTFLGKWGRYIAWGLYLFISYASLTSYIFGGGQYISSLLNATLGLSLDKWLGCMLFSIVFGGTVYLGTHLVGRLNALLFGAMVLAYVIMVGVGLQEPSSDLLMRQDWTKSLMTMPLLLTAFSFQAIVPSLTPALKGQAKCLRIAIIGGTGIAFLIYLVWQIIVQGTVPLQGEGGLEEAYIQGKLATDSLRAVVNNPWLVTAADYFAFFALATSFLGIALGLFDFLADGLRIPKIGLGNLALGLLVILPSLFFATTYPRVFLVAMEVSGGFGDAILNGIMPVLMVWVGRYYRGMSDQTYRVMGGKVMLVFVFCAYSLIVVLEAIEQFSLTTILTLD